MKDIPCIRIGHLKTVDHLILGRSTYLLKKKDPCLTRATLETIRMNSWDQICDGLTGSDLHGAFITAPLSMALFSAGLDIKLLMFAHRSGSVILRKKTPGIIRLADFKGKTFLVPSELSIQNMLLHRLLSCAGLKLGPHDDTRADVFQEVVNPFLMIEMLMNDHDDDLAGCAVAEPIGSQGICDKVAATVCTSESLWKGHPCSGFVLKSSFIEQYPKAVAELVSLFVRAGQDLGDTGNDEILCMAHNFLGQKKEIVRHALKTSAIRFDPSLLIPDTGALDMIQTYMSDTMKVLKNKIDMTDFVDNSFIINRVSEICQ